ncbi:alpha/beta hydrolase [Geojedonia litorea]|uniref:Alpha/beta hydrolase n=1 Tax=Geojedonia litorea TaxID=1268269 RepID=A0ABV9N5L2_9FLAO
MSFIHQKKLKRNIKRALVLFITVYIMIAASLYFLQEKLMLFPTVLEQDYKYQFSYSYEELFFKTEDNAVINANHFKAEQTKGVILYFHGNAGDLSRWGIIAEYFVEKNYDVLVIDYRTYGKSTGPLSEAAFYNDADLSYNYLKERYAESEITVYGRSLGTGIATFITSKHQPKQLILETPYYNIADVAKQRFSMFPVESLLKYRFPTNEFIQSVECPILIVHGTDDDVVPLSSGEKLLKEASKQKIKFVKIEGGRHNNLNEFDAYHQAIDEVLN